MNISLHGGPHLSWRLHLLQTNMPLRGASAVLLKLKDGDHMYCCTWRTPARVREETCRAKKQWKMSVYFTEGERREKDKVDRRRERFAIMMSGNKETTISRRGCRKPGMAMSLIANIANHIMNLIGRTISSLTLPDKSGSCSSQKIESRVGSSLKCDAEMSSLRQRR